MAAMLDVKELSTHYGAICAVNQVSLHVNPGEIVSLIGSNGAGKTTTTTAITGLLPIKAGDISFLGKSEIEAGIEHVFELFPRLRDRASQRAGTMSGGEQQMLAIGRALMSKPRLLLLDEPTLGLAPLIIAQIFEIIQTIRGEGVTVFLVEQNANRALQIADRGYVLENGRLVLEDTGAALLTNADVRKAYLGA